MSDMYTTKKQGTHMMCIPCQFAYYSLMVRTISA